ncbi:MAG: AI-2E family transporter [Acetobacteraceae bacterium]|nr:AI-2E family transporter [Acetobacteraceae bacterium]
MPEPDVVRNRLLAVIAGVLAVAALKWSYPVTMPLAVAVFVIAAAWPIKPRLDKALPSVLSYAGTLLVLLSLLGGFFAAVYFSLAQVVQTLAKRQDQFRQIYDRYAAWAEGRGLPVLNGEGGYDRLADLAQLVLSQAYSVLAYLGLVAVLVLLGLPEVPAFVRKVRAGVGAADQRDVFEAVGEIAGKFRGYIGVTAITSLLTGLASGAWAFAVGLELPLIWGVLNFLLNFVPVIGNIIGILPPTLYALIQFEDWTTVAVVFLGYAVLQATISNFVYPWLQGRGLSLSPVAIVVALTFWSWLWGVAGALLAVPLTAAFAIVCGHFRSTAWIAKLLSKD